MLKTCFFEDEDFKKLPISVKEEIYSEVKGVFTAMIELKLDELDIYSNLEDGLSSIFPRAFVMRDSKRALGIIYDLYDIVSDDILRDEIPPLHAYAMCSVIDNWCIIQRDIPDCLVNTKKLSQLKKTLMKCGWDKETCEDTLYWFKEHDAKLEDISWIYDSLDIYEDEWLLTALVNEYISKPETILDLNSDVDTILELMPNDLRDRFYKVKRSQQRKQFDNVDHSEYDFFISYASEDEAIAYDLATELYKRNMTVWVFPNNVTIGDSIPESISSGISKSKYCIVILTEKYFNKFWTNRELSSFISKWAKEKKKTILPIRYDVSPERVAEALPLLGDIYSLCSYDYTRESIADKLVSVVTSGSY